MKKTLKQIIWCVFLIGFAFIYSYIDKPHEIYNAEIDNSLYLNTGILFEQTLQQEFKTEEEKLDGIQIKCATFGERDNVEVRFAISEKGSDKSLREGSIKGVEAKNNKFLKIQFDTIEKTKGKTYVLSITEVGTDENNGLAFYLENSKVGNEYTIDGDNRDGVLIAKAVTHRFDLETFIIMLFFEVYLILFMKIMGKLFK